MLRVNINRRCGIVAGGVDRARLNRDRPACIGRGQVCIRGARGPPALVLVQLVPSSGKGFQLSLLTERELYAAKIQSPPFPAGHWLPNFGHWFMTVGN